MGPEDPTDDLLVALACGDAGLLEELLGLRLANREASGLDPKTYALVKLGALVALDASSASYAWQVGVAVEAGVTPAEVLGVLLAVAPQVGAARLVAAAGEIAMQLGLQKDVERPSGGGSSEISA
jgi:alkylhydroperoxidase/carboxymuconolactone decarboxylase family protein YurZ